MFYSYAKEYFSGCHRDDVRCEALANNACITTKVERKRNVYYFHLEVKFNDNDILKRSYNWIISISKSNKFVKKEDSHEKILTTRSTEWPKKAKAAVMI